MVDESHMDGEVTETTPVFRPQNKNGSNDTVNIRIRNKRVTRYVMKSHLYAINSCVTVILIFAAY